MAELGGTFDPGAVSDDRALLPDGDAPMQIFESDLVKKDAAGNIITDNTPPTKQRLELGWEIIGGPLQGRKLWTGINLQNPNATSQEIGQRELKRICDAAGVGPIRNSDELHFKPLIGRIATDKPSPGYDPKNELKGYKPYGAGTPGAAPRPAAQAQAQAPAPQPQASVPWPTR